MILSFGNKETEMVWMGIRVKNIPNEIQHIGRRKLRMLNNSQNITDLMIPPLNKPENRFDIHEGFLSIKIKNRSDIVFKWDEGQSEEVKIAELH